jgi:acetyl esterase/lipase
MADLIHPDIRSASRWVPRAPVGPRSAPVIRALGGLAARLPAKGVFVERLGPISVRVHRPSSANGVSGALLWIHGGGYVIGAAAQDDAICRHFADSLGIVVAAVDYRLAPASRFPVPLHDCHDALVWLGEQPDVDSSRIAIGGASAGGGLAAALALLARDRGEVTPAFQLLTYPMLDDRTAVRSDVDEHGFRLWNNKSNRFGWQAYLGTAPGSGAVPGLAAPARYEDLTGLAPVWIGVGSLDLFHDEDVAYAARLEAAGVPCQLDVVPGVYHGFDAVHAKANVSRAFRATQVAALAAALATESTRS